MLDATETQKLPGSIDIGARVDFGDGEWTVEGLHNLMSEHPWAWLVRGDEHVRYPMQRRLTRQQRRAMERKRKKRHGKPR